ncbi:DNA-binding response regulator [Cohnella sp.]|uniref:DNA-binding response regulator n=1 Tax=Cohnella sp. TaxID=1883426 RepID=UPI003563F659
MEEKEIVAVDEKFGAAYEKWMADQQASGTNERKNRLANIDHHAEKMFLEKVWWPSFKRFVGLSAEYEVNDFKDGRRYLDFAYHMAGYKICIEIDGHGTHWKNIDQHKFSDHLIRQNHLVLDGWIVLRFSYDDVRDKPRRCQQIIQQLLGKLSGLPPVQLAPVEKALYDLACVTSNPVAPLQAATRLGIHRKTAAKHLRKLSEKGMMIPLAANSKDKPARTIRYQVVPTDFHGFRAQ